MGEASRRGTRDERVAAAVKLREEAQAAREQERDRKDREQQDRAMAVWATLSPEEKATRLEKAKLEAESFGYLAREFGWDTAHLMTNVLSDARERRNNPVVIRAMPEIKEASFKDVPYVK